MTTNVRTALWLKDKEITEPKMQLTDALTANASIWGDFVKVYAKLEEAKNDLARVTKEHLELIDDYAELRMETRE